MYLYKNMETLQFWKINEIAIDLLNLENNASIVHR